MLRTNTQEATPYLFFATQVFFLFFYNALPFAAEYVTVHEQSLVDLTFIMNFCSICICSEYYPYGIVYCLLYFCIFSVRQKEDVTAIKKSTVRQKPFWSGICRPSKFINDKTDATTFRLLYGSIVHSENVGSDDRVMLALRCDLGNVRAHAAESCRHCDWMCAPCVCFNFYKFASSVLT